VIEEYVPSTPTWEESIIVKTTIILISLMLVVSEITFANDWTFKSAKARSALKNYKAAETKRTHESNKQAKQNRFDLILSMEEALSAETKAGNLDGAVRIRDAIKALRAGETPTSIDNVLPNLLGTWKVTYTNKTEHTRRIEKNKLVNGNSQLLVKNGDVIIDFQEVIERITLVEDKLFVEHFKPKSTYPDGNPVVMGIGRLVKGSSQITGPTAAIKNKTMLIADRKFHIRTEEERQIRYKIDIPRLETRRGVLEITIVGMGDDTGDKGMYVMLLDKNQKVIFRKFGPTKKTSVFYYDVKRNTEWWVVLEDKDTTFRGDFPGNAGIISVSITPK